MTTATTLRASRSLLLPGEQPPISHFGATLLRHAVTTGLRYVAHQLGQPLFDAPPVTIARLRVYLDRARVEATLAAPGGAIVARALLDPGGLETASPPPALRGALAFHRARQQIARAPAAAPRVPSPPTPPPRWEEFTTRLSQLLPRLNDALLAETIAAIDRRRRRGRGIDVPHCQSRYAARFLRGRPTRLDALGAPDLRAPSWAIGDAVPAGGIPGETPGVEAGIERGIERGVEVGIEASRSRGRFREWYRIALDHLRPLYGAYAAAASERGLIEDPDDAFFIPFGLGHNLAGKAAPGWLAEAVASNRSEFETAVASADVPPEWLVAGEPRLTSLAARPDWSRSPLAPLA